MALRKTYALVKQRGEGAEEGWGKAEGEEGEQVGRKRGAKHKHTNVNVGEKEGGEVVQGEGTEGYVRKEEGGKCVRKGEGKQCLLELKVKELKAPYTELSVLKAPYREQQPVLKGETEQYLYQYGGEVTEEEYEVACTGSARGEGDSCVCALAQATCDELTLKSLTDRQCASLLVYIGRALSLSLFLSFSLSLSLSHTHTH
jgi:hypothetical protein